MQMIILDVYCNAVHLLLPGDNYKRPKSTTAMYRRNDYSDSRKATVIQQVGNAENKCSGHSTCSYYWASFFRGTSSILPKVTFFPNMFSTELFDLLSTFIPWIYCRTTVWRAIFKMYIGKLKPQLLIHTHWPASFQIHVWSERANEGDVFTHASAVSPIRRFMRQLVIRHSNSVLREVMHFHQEQRESMLWKARGGGGGG